jgi:hypothetical protein
MFTLRKPRNAFMRSQYASKFNRIALSSDQYWGLAESHTFYPQFCPSPGAILRDLKGLMAFTLVLSEDGAGDLMDYGNESEDDEDYEDDEEIEDNEGVADNEEIEEEADHVNSNTAIDVPVIDASENQSPSIGTGDPSTSSTAIGDQTKEREQVVMRRILDRGEREAMEYLSKGYFRHVGNIYLQSVMASSDYWDYWELLKEELMKMCDKEKKNHPDWIRPNVSFMIVRYGLRPWKDCYEEKVHVRGDFDIGVLEQESPEYKRWMRSIYGDDEDF